MRAILFSDDDALAVARHLHAAGFEARVERERLAGEDDDEDHPWAVVTDAPLAMVELLVDEHDGWLDDGLQGGHGAGSAAAPLDLPTGPRRVKRPDLGSGA